MKEITFGFERPEDSPGFLLWQTTITWQRRIKKALDPHHISHAQFVILAIVLWFEEHDTHINQTTLAQWSKLDKMTISQALKKLASLGHVTRSEHKKDTRAKSVFLTPQGRALAQHLIPIVESIDATFFGAIVKSDEDSLIRILNTLMTKTPASP